VSYATLLKNIADNTKRCI